MSKELGDRAEQMAADYLKARGFAIVERNFHSRFGEIDIIATKDNVYHFVEVKSSTLYHPLYDITQNKLSKLIKTISIYLKKNNITSAYSLDAAAVTDRVEFYENITL